MTAVTSKQLSVTWTAATDNVGVQGYRVYRDATLVATVGTNSFSDTGLATHAAHAYTVAAIDGAGNASAQSTSAAGTTSAPVRSTNYAYDEADRLTGITPASGSAASLTFDALGRHLTRTAAGITDTYTYAGESAVVVRDAPATGTSVNAAVDAIGSRLAITTSAGGFGWALADLHGDPAGYVNSAGTGVTDATRYDPYGEVVASVSSGLPSPWGYQGRLELANAADTDLLDFGFRPYVPDLGLFTSPDDQAGSALNPLTFNRYLYAGANPETLVDPDGHSGNVNLCVYDLEDCYQLAQAGVAAPVQNTLTQSQITTVANAKENKTGSKEKQYRRHQHAGVSHTPVRVTPLGCHGSRVTSAACDSLLSTRLGSFREVAIDAYNDQQQYWADHPGGGWASFATFYLSYLAAGGSSAIVDLLLGTASDGGAVRFLAPSTATACAADQGQCQQTIGELAESGPPAFRPDVDHIFRPESGHFAIDTPENRALIQSAIRPENLHLTEENGALLTYRMLLRDGTQVWAKVYNGVISNGGLNITPLN